MPDDPKAPPPKPREPVRAKVVDAANPNRVLFEGSDSGARDFIEQHAPRTTSVDGIATPAVHLVSGSGAGSGEYYVGPEDDDPWRTVEG